MIGAIVLGAATREEAIQLTVKQQALIAEPREPITMLREARISATKRPTSGDDSSEWPAPEWVRPNRLPNDKVAGNTGAESHGPESSTRLAHMERPDHLPSAAFPHLLSLSITSTLCLSWASSVWPIVMAWTHSRLRMYLMALSGSEVSLPPPRTFMA